jgi:hypothetical protein
MTKTTIRIPGTQHTVDLLTIPLEAAVKAINFHNVGVRLIAETCGKLPFIQTTAWTYATAALLAAKKVSCRKDGTLVVRRKRK